VLGELVGVLVETYWAVREGKFGFVDKFSVSVFDK